MRGRELMCELELLKKIKARLDKEKVVCYNKLKNCDEEAKCHEAFRECGVGVTA